MVYEYYRNEYTYLQLLLYQWIVDHHIELTRKYMMRNRLLFLVFCILCFICSSCSGNSAPHSSKLVLELLNTGNGAVVTPNIPKYTGEQNWNVYVENEDAPKEQTVMFNGKTYTGTYNRSITYYGTSAVRNRYSTETEDEGIVDFEVDAFGELVGIAFPQRSQFSSELEKPRLETEESRHEVVLQYAKMLADVDEYKLVQFGNTVVLPTNGQLLYHYRLYYMVNGVETSDYVAVSILDRGGLMYLDVLQNKWAKQHQAQLEAFPVNEALQMALSSCGLKNPTVSSKLFGILKEEAVLLINVEGYTESGQTALIELIARME